MIQMGKIEGSAPKVSRSPVTRRHVNNIADIQGARPRDRGSIPENMKSDHSLTRLQP